MVETKIILTAFVILVNQTLRLYSSGVNLSVNYNCQKPIMVHFRKHLIIMVFFVDKLVGHLKTSKEVKKTSGMLEIFVPKWKKRRSEIKLKFK